MPDPVRSVRAAQAKPSARSFGCGRHTATPADRPTTVSQRRGQCPTFFPDEGTGVALHTAERRHRAAHHGWTRDPPAPDYRTHGRTEIPTAPARPHPAGTAEITFKM